MPQSREFLNITENKPNTAADAVAAMDILGNQYLAQAAKNVGLPTL